MFGFGPVELAIALLILALLEVALLWAAAALGDAPPLSWTKTVAVALGVTVAWVALNCVLAVSTGVGKDPLAPDKRPLTLAVAGLALVVAWAIPAVLYPALLSVSIPRGMLISVFQVLLRGLLYVLILAVLMVVLAVLQIAWGPTSP